MARALCLAYHIDWPRIVLNVRNAGCPLSRVADMVGCEGGMLDRLANSKLAEPPFSIACGLLDLHERLCGDQHDIAALKTRAVKIREEQRS